MAKKPPRKVIVLASFMGILTLTSALLLTLAPPPLNGAGSFQNLWAADNGGDASLGDAIFKTRVAARQGEWKYIYIHDGGAGANAAAGNGDHFVVANGLGEPDGQIIMTQRWNMQTRAAPAAVQSIDPACISICVRGDFDAAPPTAGQVRRLTELVSTLQSQLGIGGDEVYLLPDAGAGAGIGRRFPVDSVRQEILP